MANYRISLEIYLQYIHFLSSPLFPFSSAHAFPPARLTPSWIQSILANVFSRGPDPEPREALIAAGESFGGFVGAVRLLAHAFSAFAFARRALVVVFARLGAYTLLFDRLTSPPFRSCESFQVKNAASFSNNSHVYNLLRHNRIGKAN